MFRSVAFCLPLLFALSARAQEPIASPVDSTLLWEQAVLKADSARDTLAAVEHRLVLAAHSSSGKALRLFQEAAALADSASLEPVLALRAYEGQVQVLTGMGEMTKANRAWTEVMRCKEAVVLQEMDRLRGAEREAAVERTAQLKDSLSALLTAERGAAAEKDQALRAERELWMYGAIGAGVIALAALVILAILHFGPAKRLRHELAELRQEVNWLRVVHRKHLEVKNAPPPPAVPPVPPPAPAPVAIAPAPAPVTSAAENEDAVLLELVKRRSVERLVTLREARMSGDREKVIRVVRSLKPQLVSLDASYFNELCGRLVAEEADATSWSQDLDRFERGVERLIEGRA
jgi:hypothetical protein